MHRPHTIPPQEPLNQPLSTDTIEPGDFTLIRNAMYRMFLHDAYQAVEMADAWESLRNESPPDDKGFMFHSSATTDKIQECMRYANIHSGASYGITMRCMEHIAKKGWAAFVNEYVASQKTD